MGGAGNRKLILSSAGLLLAGGCASTGPTPIDYGVRHIRNADAAVVFDASQEALSSVGYRIEQADESAGVITTQPTPTTLREESTLPGGRRRSRARLRRAAQVRVAARPDAVDVYCRVVVEEQTTEAHRMFEHDLKASDNPGETAIDRGAAATMEQNTVWRIVLRDKAAEQRILDAVVAAARKP